MPFPKHGDEFHTTPGGGGSGTAVVMYAESNSPTLVDAGTRRVGFDTFYDVAQADLSGILPPELGLTYDDSTPGSEFFEATADGVWAVTVGAEVEAAPGETGYLELHLPSYGYWPRRYFTASGNDSPWRDVATFAMKTGEQFYCYLLADAGVNVQFITYLELDIIRIAGAVM